MNMNDKYVNLTKIYNVISKQLFLFVLIVFLCINFTIHVHADSDWKSAYADRLKQTELSSVAGNVVMLRDMDIDGVPELFFGHDYPGYSYIESAWTFKNGTLRKISLPDSNSKGEEGIFISSIQNAELYYNKGLNEFRFFGPNTYQHTFAGEDQHVRLIYDGSSLKAGPEIYNIKWLEKYDRNTEKSYREEVGYSFAGISMEKDDFYKRLDSFYAGWKHENSNLLIADGSGISSSDNGNAIQNITLWTEDHKWIDASLKQFMDIWNPIVVTGTHRAVLNSMRFTFDDIKDENSGDHLTTGTLSSYLLFGNNYVRIRDLAESLNNTSFAFNVSWDGSCVRLKKDSAYTGNAISSIGKDSIATAHLSSQPVYIENEQLAVTTYLINNENYIRLRDIAPALGLNVGWNDKMRIVTLS